MDDYAGVASSIAVAVAVVVECSREGRAFSLLVLVGALPDDIAVVVVEWSRGGRTLSLLVVAIGVDAAVVVA